MDCPRCSQTMHEIDTNETVTVDFCSGCKGIFFDGGEVAVYFELPEDLPEGEARLDDARERAIACPRCGRRMELVRFRRDENLVLDHCSGCGGMWFDRGEVPQLEKISAQMGETGARLAVTFQRLREQGYEVIGAR